MTGCCFCTPPSLSFFFFFSQPLYTSALGTNDPSFWCFLLRLSFLLLFPPVGINRNRLHLRPATACTVTFLSPFFLFIQGASLENVGERFRRSSLPSHPNSGKGIARPLSSLPVLLFSQVGGGGGAGPEDPFPQSRAGRGLRRLRA